MTDRSRPHRFAARAVLCFLAAALLHGCGAGGIIVTSGSFRVVASEPSSGGTLFLNDPIALDFTSKVDLQSVNQTTVTFEVLDTQGSPLLEAVDGTFVIDTRPGDAQPGRRLRFEPRLATDNAYTDGSLRAERVYVVRLPGGPSAGGATLLAADGTPLAQSATLVFSTPIGTQPGQLFRNPLPNGPQTTGFDITTGSANSVAPLGLFGAPPLEVRVHFDQALNPSDDNVPVNLDTDPLVLSIADRGRVFLEYNDPVLGADTWIPADVSLERNDLSGATITLRPVGVLPNSAEIRVIAEPTLEDIAGESNVSAVNYNRVVAAFKTSSSYEQQWNGIVEDFAASTAIDTAAVFAETPAEVGPGFVRSGFAFEGTSTTLDYQPSGTVVLNTAFTQLTPTMGLPINVAGGVFNLRNVNIPQGVTVIGQGPNPMVWLCTGSLNVSGTLTVRGGNGATVDTLQSASFPKAGGIGNCGGGNGGDGTPSATERDLRGGNGRGPGQQADRGGRGGYLACTAGCYTGSGYNGSGGGSGGGGGAMATQGDLNWRGTVPTGIVPNTPGSANTSFQQVLGYGGSGCSGTSVNRTAFLAGGEPGELLFTDNREDNNFWGSAIDLNRGLRITGELSVPTGGSGGGGGGDTSPSLNCSVSGGFPASDYSGGGGGGGGGVLIVKALGQITITSTGKIIADGGHGGGGEQVGACGEAGGGGGGAGGMVVLMSAKGIVIEAHGDPNVGAQGRFVYGSPTTVSTPTYPFLGNDYDFAISADGGVCTTGGFGSVYVSGKYRLNGQSMLPGTTYDADPLGGLGGMGIVQLMAPPGDNTQDATNTRLDDNVHFRLPGVPSNLSGAQKRQLLAWRGVPNAQGIFVDDFGNPTDIGSNEGEIRPAPVLLPTPFQARSRARSKWIDTGASQRRPLAAADFLPRGIVTAGGAVVGPVFEFAGLEVASVDPGYVAYSVVGASTRIDQPIVVPSAATQLIDDSASYLGQPAVRIRLAAASAALAQADRYVQYEAELLDNVGTVLAGYRILSHDQQDLLVAPGEPIPTGAVAVQIRAKFFSVVTDGVDGLGATYLGTGGVPVPRSNVRIGFAFHQAPDPSNLLLGRYPASSQNDFVHDLTDPGLQAWIAANGAPRYVQWDVVFDMQYAPTASVPPPLSATLASQELRFLRLPFRF